MSISRVDLILFPLVLLVGIIFGSVQVASMPGVPAHGRYHASDMDDLQEQLLGDSVLPKAYSAASDHPAWLMMCGLYQRASSATGLRGMTLWNLMTPVVLGVNLCLFLGLARQLRFDRPQALGLTAVFLATGATITWSVVLETHVLAPTTLLLTALILTNRRSMARLWHHPTPATVATYGLATALAASITITNIMLAMLAVVPCTLTRRPNLRRLMTRMAKRVPTLLTGLLVGIGILSLIHVTSWYLIQDREMRQFLEVMKERRMISSMRGSWWDSILALAWIAPPMDDYDGAPEILQMLALERTWSTFPAYLSGVVVLGLTLWSLTVVSARQAFMPLFVLFGVVLHSIYGLGESFLYTSNYAWATVLSVGLLGRTMTPRALAAIAFVVAIIMFIVNLAIWHHGIEWIITNDYLLPPVHSDDG